MSQSALVVPALTLCVWAIWVRRRTFHFEWDRILTIAVLLQAVGFVLSNPAHSPIGQAVYAVTGVAHLRDFLGHVAFICSCCCVIYSAALRLVPDSELRLMMHKVEIPSCLAVSTMLAAITNTVKLKGPPPADLLDVPCDVWLKIYWLTYVGITAYLLFFLIRLLVVLRTDPRSRISADLFIFASGVGILALTAIAAKALGWPLPNSWIWSPVCISGSVAASATAWSWRRRVRPFIRSPLYRTRRIVRAEEPDDGPKMVV
jgi:hypothetical protein